VCALIVGNTVEYADDGIPLATYSQTEQEEKNLGIELPTSL
jgi:hypothetical protein